MELEGSRLRDAGYLVFIGDALDDIYLRDQVRSFPLAGKLHRHPDHVTYVDCPRPRLTLVIPPTFTLMDSYRYLSAPATFVDTCESTCTIL